MSDKALSPATLELTQKIQLHFPREIATDVLRAWNGAPTQVISDRLLEVFGNYPITATSEPAPPAQPIVKFGLLVDLGIITVPADYDHITCLAAFKKRHQSGKKKSFYGYNDDSNDQNFPNPTRILKAGDKLLVSAFKQIVKGETTSEERMKFLAEQGAIHVGAQGLTHVFDQKRDQLPKGYRYSSFDEKERLWPDGKRIHRVPDFDADSDGDFYWDLGRFEDPWGVSDAVLCFRDLPETSVA